MEKIVKEPYSSFSFSLFSQETSLQTFSSRVERKSSKTAYIASPRPLSSSFSKVHFDPWIVLFDTCQSGDLQLVNELISEELLMMSCPQTGRTLLHAAVRGCHVTILRALLKFHHASTLIDVQCTLKGLTALHMAVRAGSRACTQILLQHGASVDIEDYSGDTPVDLVNARCLQYDEWEARQLRQLLVSNATTARL